MKRLMAVILALSLSLLAGWAIRRIGADPHPNGLLRLAVQDSVVCAVPFLAAQRGWFERESVQTILCRYPSGIQALAALERAEADVATASDVAVAAACARRADIVVLAAIAGTDRAARIVARRDRGIEHPYDLRDQTIGTAEGTSAHFFLAQYLLRRRIGAHDARIVFLPPDDLPAALADGRLDAIAMWNPYATVAARFLGEQAVEFEDTTVYRHRFLLVASRAAIRRRPEDLARLLRALRGALTEIRADPSAAAAGLATILAPARAAEVRTDWPRYDLMVNLDQSLILALEDQARWLYTSGQSTDTVDNILDFIEYRPLEAADPRSVRLIR